MHSACLKFCPPAPPLQSAVFLNIYLCGAATATGENTHRYNSSPKNQPNIGLVSKVPIIFVGEQNTCQSLPVSSACVCLDWVFFLLKLMKLFDTKYEKHANPSPGCCHPDPAGKNKTPSFRRQHGKKKSISIRVSTENNCLIFIVFIIVHIKKKKLSATKPK